MGDCCGGLQVLLRERVGRAPKAARGDAWRGRRRAGWLSETLDDLVEDAFKLCCVASHFWVGWLLRSSLTSLSL